MYKMYQPSNAMPIDNYSVVQPSTQQKTFGENNICRFSLPFNTIPFFDPHSSYLQVLAECSGTDKMELNGNSSVVIKYIRLSVNGIVLEEIDEFNQLAHLYNVYGHDDSSREHEAVFTLDSAVEFTTGLMGNQSGDGRAVSLGERKCKLIIPMKECGLFSSLEIVPLMAFGENLDVEIRFAPNNEVLKTYQRSGLEVKNRLTELLINEGTTNGTGITEFTLETPYKGFSSVGDIPLQLGEKVQLMKRADSTTAGAEVVVEKIERVATTTAGTEYPNQIKITCATTNATSTNVAGTLYLKKTKDTADSATPVGTTMTYSNVEWYLQKVVPPAQYVASLKKQLNSPQGFQYDIHTWTTYKANLLQGVKSQTIEIPAYQSRAKSVMVIPRRANQTPTLNLDNSIPDNYVDGTNGVCPNYQFEGQFANLKDYQFQVNNGLRVPTRPVNLDVMNGHLKHLSAEHLIQLTQTLGSSNIGVRNIKDSREHFIIGRQLSKYGGTTNLNSAMRVYVNYEGNTDPVVKLQPITFINHINRVAVNASGLQVFN